MIFKHTLFLIPGNNVLNTCLFQADVFGTFLYVKIITKYRVMKISENKSEQLHPQDKRVIDTPFVLIDTPQFFDQVKAEKQWPETDHNTIPVFRSSYLSTLIIAMKTVATIDDKTGDNITCIHVLNGDIKCIIQDGEIVLHPQQQIIFHEGILDKIEAINDADIILTNYKTREKRSLSL